MILGNDLIQVKLSCLRTQHSYAAKFNSHLNKVVAKNHWAITQFEYSHGEAFLSDIGYQLYYCFIFYIQILVNIIFNDFIVQPSLITSNDVVHTWNCPLSNIFCFFLVGRSQSATSEGWRDSVGYFIFYIRILVNTIFNDFIGKVLLQYSSLTWMLTCQCGQVTREWKIFQNMNWRKIITI